MELAHAAKKERVRLATVVAVQRSAGAVVLAQVLVEFHHRLVSFFRDGNRVEVGEVGIELEYARKQGETSGAITRFVGEQVVIPAVQVDVVVPRIKRPRIECSTGKGRGEQADGVGVLLREGGVVHRVVATVKSVPAHQGESVPEAVQVTACNGEKIVFHGIV